MDKIEMRMAAEAASLSRIGTSILKLKDKKLKVKWLPKGNELGYTSGEELCVNIAWEHEIMKALNDAEKSMMRMGVFAHELLHQCLTNFEYSHVAVKGMSRSEAAIFMNFANTLEDPAIEYFAPNIFGGRMLDALRFHIRHIYKVSPGIEESKNAFAQLINALINFGDMGMVKGKFTYPEAGEFFLKIAPLYSEGIKCPDSRRRIDIAKECMEITRPLWEESVKENEFFEELLRELLKMLKASGLHLYEDNENEFDPSAYETDASDRREKAVRKITAAIPSEKGKVSKDDQNTECDQNDSDDADGIDNTDCTDSTDSVARDGELPDVPLCDVAPISANDFTVDNDTASEIADGIYIVDEDEIRKLEEELKTDVKKVECEERKSESDALYDLDGLPDYDLPSKYYKKVSCRNIQVQVDGDASSMYNELARLYEYDIKRLFKSLDQIFKSDMEALNRSTRGSYNILRGSSGTTARMFDKRKSPDNLKDVSIMLAVDISGSMHGEKIKQARRMAIVFAEALTRLKIPYYIMGYTADMGYDAEHYHYVTWKNRTPERQSLVSLKAQSNNFDGYSIRYAAKLLSERRSERKIMFVISDGQPAASKYVRNNGIPDTAEAIKEARKSCTVFGIALGQDCTPEVLQRMYGKDFIWCENETLLTNTLCKKLKKIIESK